MPPHLDPELVARLEYLLDEQEQVVSRRQLVGIGFPDVAVRTRLRSKLWQRGFPGTYITHNGAVSYLATAWSGLFYAGEGALLSYQTAAYIDRLLDTTPPAVHVSVPSHRRVVPQPGLIVHHSARLGEQARLQPGPPRTGVEETVLDLVAEQQRRDDVAALITSACQRRLTTPERLRAAGRARPRMRWRGLVVELLEDAAAGVDSVLERRYYRDVERAHGLPRGSRQHFVVRNGRREYRDVVYDEYAVVVELDGLAYHQGERLLADRARDNAGVARGEVSLRYVYADVAFTPCETSVQVAAVLRQRGWDGEWQPCPRCREPSRPKFPRR